MTAGVNLRTVPRPSSVRDSLLSMPDVRITPSTLGHCRLRFASFGADHPRRAIAIPIVVRTRPNRVNTSAAPRQYDFREVRLTSGALRRLASRGQPTLASIGGAVALPWSLCRNLPRLGRGTPQG